ncbi:MAG: hypothetical protein ACF8PN_13060 [Phycisphaerales bacterium]
MADAHPTREAITVVLADSDATCDLCGYSLRGVSSERCPECGGRIRLEVITDDVRPWWWTCSVLATGASVAMAGGLLSPIIMQTGSVLADPRIPQLVAAGLQPQAILPHWIVLVRLGTLLIACLALFAFALTRRRWMARLPSIWRGAIAIPMIGSPLLIVAAAYLMMR